IPCADRISAQNRSVGIASGQKRSTAQPAIANPKKKTTAVGATSPMLKQLAMSAPADLAISVTQTMTTMPVTQTLRAAKQ
ncbi:hypothetical protein, partial [Klebsiella aerogenes]|uniref:hypothetical protein n=1 Tax=Klebsiella aerogenes TaxID=548 RepID=UPI0019533200